MMEGAVMVVERRIRNYMEQLESEFWRQKRQKHTLVPVYFLPRSSWLVIVTNVNELPTYISSCDEKCRDNACDRGFRAILGHWDPRNRFRDWNSPLLSKHIEARDRAFFVNLTLFGSEPSRRVPVISWFHTECLFIYRWPYLVYIIYHPYLNQELLMVVKKGDDHTICQRATPKTREPI